MKRFLCLLLSAALVLSASACAHREERAAETAMEEESTAGTESDASVEKQYIYREAVPLLSNHWNPHTCETPEEDYPNRYLSRGLYRIYFKDGEKDGEKPLKNYEILPEMAAELPEDITEEARAAFPQFHIPAAASSGYAFRIPLNPCGAWENGIKINAHTYEESMKRLLDPALGNPRASDMYFGEFQVAGAENYANQGKTLVLSLQELSQRGEDPEDFMKEPGMLNWARTFGARYDWEAFPWKKGQRVDPGGFSLEAEDRFADSGLTAGDLLEFLAAVWELDPGEPLLKSEVFVKDSYPETVDYSQVGLFAEGEDRLILILEKPISEFSLLYNLRESWLVEPGLYDACTKLQGGKKVCSYGSSPDTTLSCGPYRLTEFTSGERMFFERNSGWYGYQDGKHRFLDPQTGESCPMFQTDAIEVREMKSGFDQKSCFLKGGLTVYGLQPEDYVNYRNSRYCYADPSEVTLFLILNGELPELQRREQEPGFDSSARDLETITLQSFRRAIFWSIDRELFAAAVDPACTGAYGLINPCYISNPETGERYRDTEQGRRVLCSAYGVDPEDFGGDLQAAAASIAGCQPETARELYDLAFREALEKGFVTDGDQDGLSDQKITIELCVSQSTEVSLTIAEQLNEQIRAAARGTPFEGRISFVQSEPRGNDWYGVFAAGRSELIVAGWTGNILNPYSMTELYTDGIRQYDAGWFDAGSFPLTLTLSGEKQALTLSLRQWSRALNGTDVTADGRTLNFGPLSAGEETRLEILGAIEETILNGGNYIPVIRKANVHLLSQQVRYAAEQFHPVLGHGGLEYLRYEYTDAQWAEYVAEKGGELTY